MENFEEFMNEQIVPTDRSDFDADSLVKNTRIDLSRIDLNISVARILMPKISSTEKSQEFAENVSQVTHSSEFISELSNKIGLPLASKTEDEFVERSSKILRKMLYSKFGIKD